MGLIGKIASRAEVGTHPEGRVGWVSGVHDHVGTLTNAECDNIRRVWPNWDKVVCHHCHIMTVDGEALNTLRAAIDESQTMFLARGEFELSETSIRRALLSVSNQGAIVIHLSVDQIVIGEWRGRASLVAHDLLYQVKVISVVPVGKKNRANVNVVWYVLWTVNDNGYARLAVQFLCQ